MSQSLYGMADSAHDHNNRCNFRDCKKNVSSPALKRFSYFMRITLMNIFARSSERDSSHLSMAEVPFACPGVLRRVSC